MARRRSRRRFRGSREGVGPAHCSPGLAGVASRGPRFRCPPPSIAHQVLAGSAKVVDGRHEFRAGRATQARTAGTAAGRAGCTPGECARRRQRDRSVRRVRPSSARRRHPRSLPGGCRIGNRGRAAGRARVRALVRDEDSIWAQNCGRAHGGRHDPRQPSRRGDRLANVALQGAPQTLLVSSDLFRADRTYPGQDPSQVGRARRRRARRGESSPCPSVGRR